MAEKLRTGDLGRLISTIASTDVDEDLRRRAFGEIVDRFQDMAYGYAYARLGDSGLAEDAAQESFLAAWRKLPQLRDGGAFPSWFKRIVFTQSYAIRRRRPVFDAAVECIDAVDPMRLAVERESAGEVRRAIAELPEHERDVVMLFYVNEFSRDEIAAFLGISVVAVKKRLSSARAKLRKRMIPMVQDDLQARRPSRNGDFAVKVIAFTSQFGNYLGTGVPILRTLDRCAVQNEDTPELAGAIREMRSVIARGDRLRDALERYPRLFDPAYIDAISFGEMYGSLDVVLDRLAQGERFDTPEKLSSLEREMADRQKAEEQIPRLMALFPNLFQEGDLRAMAIGEETGTVPFVLHRLTRGVEFDNDEKLQALREEMTSLAARIRAHASSPQ